MPTFFAVMRDMLHIYMNSLNNSMKLLFMYFLYNPTTKLNVIYKSLKSRDITLPTKVRLVKAMVFPVVMSGCESWNIKTVEHQRIDALEL